MDHNNFEPKICKKDVQNRGKVGFPVAKGSEVQFSLNLFSRNFLEFEPEPKLEPNFVFGPEGSGSNQGSGPNFHNANSEYLINTNFCLCHSQAIRNITMWQAHSDTQIFATLGDFLFCLSTYPST
jgi:hypothetical protein